MMIGYQTLDARHLLFFGFVLDMFALHMFATDTSNIPDRFKVDDFRFHGMKDIIRNNYGFLISVLISALFALLNSTVYDRYMSIVSKSKQINSKEMRSLPLPPRNIIENIGMRLMAVRQTTVAACDQIVNPTLHIIEK